MCSSSVASIPLAMSGDHYQLLGIEHDAPQKQVAKAFRAKARVLHPDKQPPGISEAERQRATAVFQELTKAYEVISDADKRAHYDFTLNSASFAAASAASSSGPASASGGRAGAAEPPRGGSGSGGSSSGGGGYTRSERFPDRTKAEWEQERRRYAAGWNGVDGPGDAASGPSGAPRRMRQEHEEEERQRREELEQRQKLGSHWVKAPPRPSPQKWEGWVQSGKMASGAGARADDDDEDDSSSVLSFDIGIDLNNLDLLDLEPIDAQDNMGEGLGQAEVWRINPAEPKVENAAAAKNVGVEAAKGKTGKGVKPCCAIQ